MRVLTNAPKKNEAGVVRGRADAAKGNPTPTVSSPAITYPTKWKIIKGCSTISRIRIMKSNPWATYAQLCDGVWYLAGDP